MSIQISVLFTQKINIVRQMQQQHAAAGSLYYCHKEMMTQKSIAVRHSQKHLLAGRFELTMSAFSKLVGGDFFFQSFLFGLFSIWNENNIWVLAKQLMDIFFKMLQVNYCYSQGQFKFQKRDPLSDLSQKCGFQT